MIRRIDIEERVREWGLREDVVEKDYVIGWLLWGIGSDPVLGKTWAFKGGTCLKKCYVETYRFSEDLDFTVLPGGSIAPSEVEGPLSVVLERVAEASGIDFSRRAPALKGHDSGRYTAGRVYYVGPRRTPGVASVKLDLSGSEVVVRPTVMRAIAHAYPDALPDLSVEPLLGPIPGLPLGAIHWVIVGGESGPGARPMQPSWVKEIRSACHRARVPFFFKQWGGVNRKRTGRELDGRTWDAMPRSTHPALVGGG